MDLDLERRAAEVFARLCECDEHEIEAAIIDACRGDQSLENRVRELLEAASQDEHLLDGELAFGEDLAGTPLDVESYDSSAIPERIGDCRVTGVLGTGGMGIVYRGIQDQPSRPVAIKVVRAPGMSKLAARRFRRETEFLGRLDHPGIARVYTSGVYTHPGGSFPYLVMELVPDAAAIDDYASRRMLGPEDVLRLMSEVCDAVQAAHARLIVHRDLKPANILVDGEGRARIIDFGIAKALGPIEGVPTIATEASRIVGTAHYMSPELLERGTEAAGTRSDVFAIGVILYELLAGVRPFGDDRTTMYEVMHRITKATSVPDKPSFRRLPVDLRTIIAKALAHDPEMRYGSASELAQDVRRYLSRQPIEARPPSKAYVASKFIERHRIASALSVVTVAGLMMLTVVSVVAKGREHDARLLADERARETSIALYISAMGAAARAYEDGDTASVAYNLKLAPKEWRGWDHRFLASLINTANTTKTLENDIEGIRFDDSGQLVAWGPFCSARIGEGTPSWTESVPIEQVSGRPPTQILVSNDLKTQVVASYKGDQSGSVKIEIRRTGTATLTISLDITDVRSSAIDPSGKYIAVGGGSMHGPQEMSYLIDAAAGTILWQGEFAGPMVMSDDSLLIASDQLCRIPLGMTDAIAPIAQSSVRNPSGVVLSGDAKRAAIRSAGTIVVFDMESHQNVLDYQEAHREGPVALDETGRWLIAAEGQVISVIDVDSGQRSISLRAPHTSIKAIAVSSSLDHIAVLDASNQLHRWQGVLGWCDHAIFARSDIALAQDSAAVCFETTNFSDQTVISICRDPFTRKIFSYAKGLRSGGLAISDDGKRAAWMNNIRSLRVIDATGADREITLPENFWVESMQFWGSGEERLDLLATYSSGGRRVVSIELETDPEVISVDPEKAPAELRSISNEMMLYQYTDRAELVDRVGGVDRASIDIDSLWLADSSEDTSQVVMLDAHGGLSVAETGHNTKQQTTTWPGSQATAMRIVDQGTIAILQESGLLWMWRHDLGDQAIIAVRLVDDAVVQGDIAPNSGVAIIGSASGGHWFPIRQE